MHGERRVDLVPDERLDLLDLLRGHRLGVREIESKFLVIHQRTFLVDGVPEDLAEGVVEHVGHGVVGHDVASAVVVHAGMHGVADGDDAVDGRADVKHETRRRLRVLDSHRRPGDALDDAHVAHLAAGLGVERGLIEDEADGTLHGLGGSNESVEGENRLDRGVGVRVAGGVLVGVVGERDVVVGEPRGSLRFEQQGTTAALLTGGAGLLLRLLESLLEAGVVALHRVFLAHDLHEVHGEPEGFPQEESLGAGDGVASLFLGLGGDLLELLHALEQRTAEGFLLLGDDLRHALLLLDNLGENLAEQFHHRLDERREETLLGAELLAAEPHRAPEHAAEHVVAPVAPRRGAVADGEG